jgi:hypothetical protein
MDMSKEIREMIDKIKSFDNIKLNENFRKWFGGSKIITNGKPIICYHGTRGDFKIFNPSKTIGNQGELDQIEGIYFTDNKEGASFFSTSDDDKFLKSCFLSIKNPYIVNDNNALKTELKIDKFAVVNNKLKKMGYDGLIMERGFYAKGGPHKLFLAFYPHQVKSILNDGSWDINDNNIYS